MAKRRCEMLYTLSHKEEPHIRCAEPAAHICTSGKFKGMYFCTRHANEGIRFGHKMAKIK